MSLDPYIERMRRERADVEKTKALAEVAKELAACFREVWRPAEIKKAYRLCIRAREIVLDLAQD